MKILHLAAANRWSGAAAPAFAEVQALRAAGVDAHYAYVGGYKLEERIGASGFAHGLIQKAQNPVAFWRSAQDIMRLVREERFDLVHAHLTYDHWLARIVGPRRGMAVARTFHTRRTLRTDFVTKWMLTRTDATFVINDALASAAALNGRDVVVTPPPLDPGLFSSEGSDVRAKYGLDPSTPVALTIGKIFPGRGFEEVFRTFAVMLRSLPQAKLLVIGAPRPHKDVIVALAKELQITGSIIWAGYHEDDLAEHYRSADVLLFARTGSDEGHRAVIEAMGCGLPPATYPIEGIGGVLGPLRERNMAAEGTPEALARVALEILSRRAEAKREAIARAAEFSFPRSAERLLQAYQRVIRSTSL